MWLNFSKYHNHALKHMLEKIPRDPTVTIIYGDYYRATLEITRNPLKHGKLNLVGSIFVMSK